MKKLSLGGSVWGSPGESEPRGSPARDCSPVACNSGSPSHFPGLLSQRHSRSPSPSARALGPSLSRGCSRGHRQHLARQTWIFPIRGRHWKGGLGRAQEWVLVLSPMNLLGIQGWPSLGGLHHSPIPMQTTAQGLPQSWALAAPPSASCAECLDNWMECFAATVLPGSRSSDFKRGGARMLAPGRGQETQEVKYESGAHFPIPVHPTPHNSLLRPEQDHRLSSPRVVGSWNQAPAPGRTGQQMETAKWCQRFGGANLVRSGPGDSLGSGRGRAQDSTLRTLRLLAKIPQHRWVRSLPSPFYR